MSKIHKFPEAIKAQINENSQGGYILFTINDEGALIPHLHYDNDVVKRALIDFGSDYLEVLKHKYKAKAANGLFGGEGEEV